MRRGEMWMCPPNHYYSSGFVVILKTCYFNFHEKRDRWTCDLYWSNKNGAKQNADFSTEWIRGTAWRQDESR